MHPFWLANQELDEIHPRHNEHYYYTHQQLLARLFLEREHIIQDYKSLNKTNDRSFNPYLIHANGLPFPVRSNVVGDWNEEKAKIKSIDIAIRECMARALIIMVRQY